MKTLWMISLLRGVLKMEGSRPKSFKDRERRILLAT